VKRDLEERLKPQMEKQIVKVVTGIRRSGKSTLALLLLQGKKFGYVNFDEKELIDINLDELLSGILEIYGNVKFLLLDEIQNVDGWELWVNSLQRSGYNIIITGSNAKLLSKELATHLTGRYVEFENFPFNFREFLRWKKFDLQDIEFLKEKEGKLKFLLREYLRVGGFPEFLVKQLEESYLKTLFDAVIYKDVVRRWNVKYPTKIEDLARYLISIHGREYTATKIRNLLGFRSTFTVQNYIKYLEEAYLIISLERFSKKTKEFLKAPKKVFSIDVGLANAISVKAEKEVGRSMENVVFLQLKNKGYKENRNLFYFKDYQQHEVDFVVKEGLDIKQLIQVTYASGLDEIEKRELRSLVKASDLLKCKNLLVITWDYEDEIEFKWKKIKFVPLWKWLLVNKI
ncbi:MAG: ATP-binding protein, partial [Candidatus Aenigmarchaeota archaeon]|nr:ATP-binding protein [Candidatus Aenigmarchaeota archaeon]